MSRIFTSTFTGFDFTAKNTTDGTVSFVRRLERIDLAPGQTYTDKISSPFNLNDLPGLHLPPTSCVLRRLYLGAVQIQGYVKPSHIHNMCSTFTNVDLWPIKKWNGDVGVYHDSVIEKGMVAGTWWFNTIVNQNFCISTVMVGWYGPYSGGVAIITTKGGVIPLYRIQEEYEEPGYLDLNVFEPGLAQV